MLDGAVGLALGSAGFLALALILARLGLRARPVIAAAAGTVEKLFDSKLGGHTLYSRRPGGQWIDYYAHLDAYVPGLAEGQKIAQGVMIGAVGSTGDASPEAPHLHYAINAMAPGEGWWQGKAVNPYPMLKAGH